MDDDDEERERRQLSLVDLIGLRRLTALSSRHILGIDDVFYRWNGLNGFNEIFDDELIELETAIVVNRMDCFVSFQAYTKPPLEWPGVVYALDERTSKVLVEIGWTIGMQPYRSHRRLRLNGDRTDSYTAVEEIIERFHYTRGGDTPKWLKGTRETTGLR